VNIESILSICLGIGLAASAGFRVFLPLFALSMAGYFNFLELNESWIWLGSLSSMIILGVATMVEIVAYIIPYVDNLLDSIAVPLAALAGTIVVLSTLVNFSPEITWALAIIAGGGTAAVISGSSGATRLTSTATTGGIGNPVVSFIETGTAIVMSFISIVLPIVAIILVLLIFLIIFRVYKKFTKSKV
jgi:hypothetical protein